VKLVPSAMTLAHRKGRFVVMPFDHVQEHPSAVANPDSSPTWFYRICEPGGPVLLPSRAQNP